MTQDVSFGASNSESDSASESAIALSVSIADPFVLLRMSDGSIRLLIGGKLLVRYFCSNKLYLSTFKFLFHSSHKHFFFCWLYACLHYVCTCFHNFWTYNCGLNNMVQAFYRCF